MSAAVLEYLATSSMATHQPEDARPRPPERLGEAQPEQSRVAERGEEVVGVLPASVDLPGPWPHLVLGQAPDRGLELRQLRGQVEVHPEKVAPSYGLSSAGTAAAVGTPGNRSKEAVGRARRP